MVVSFLLPTRGRAALAERSIASLVATASDPARIEIMLALDHDDREAGEAVVAACRNLGVAWQAWWTPRLGYANLHTYVNKLAALACGDWFWIWNDDVTMLTKGWDDALTERTGTFCVGDPHIPNAARLFSRGLFPVVPRPWLDTLHHISKSPHNDTYIFDLVILLARNVGYQLYWPMDIDVYHDRFDETGNNNDATYQERVYLSDSYHVRASDGKWEFSDATKELLYDDFVALKLACDAMTHVTTEAPCTSL